jgi:hypothetical protein
MSNRHWEIQPFITAPATKLWTNKEGGLGRPQTEWKKMCQFPAAALAAGAAILWKVEFETS